VDLIHPPIARSDPMRAIVVVSSIVLSLAVPCFSVVIAPNAALGRSPDEVWTEIPSEAVTITLGEAVTLSEAASEGAVPGKRIFLLNRDRLDSAIAGVPAVNTLAERRDGGRLLSLPKAGGGYVVFEVFETRLLPPELAEELPGVRTFSGRSIENPAVTASIEQTPEGLSAMVFSPSGRAVLSRLVRGGDELYVVAEAPSAGRDPSFRCLVEGSSDRGATSGDAFKLPAQYGGFSRTYRLAIAATADYTNYFRLPEDTEEQARQRAFDEILFLISRLNHVYTRDLGIEFVLVPKQREIIFTDKNQDPYRNLGVNALLDENQRTLDRILGPSEYDIGHVVSTVPGGRATVGSACTSSHARGATGSARPTSDTFYIDYVAHEIGHQLGANHTFNGSFGSCSGNRNAATAYEPGSGSTIMGYAGICPGQDVVQNSFDYFHAVSLDEILAHLHGNGSCAGSVANGNQPPALTLNGPALRRIPAGTPFHLGVTAADPDGDPLRFTWEQYDLGNASPPDDDSDGNRRPMFLSRRTPDPLRLLPDLPNLIDQVPAYQSWEALPTKGGGITFRLMARDYRGGFRFVDTRLDVVGSTGPFVVLQPSAGSDWKGGTKRTVTWDVARTDKAPIGVAQVQIFVSLDRGATFAPLGGPVPNDGGHDVTLPTVTAPVDALVRVEALGSPFFALSSVFTIFP
jgi:hypothetical protein